MVKLRVEKCCWYFNLRSGCLAILIFQAVCSALTIVSSALLGYTVGTFTLVQTDIECGIVLIVSLIAVYAILENKSSLALIPWMVWTIFSILASTFACIGMLIDPDSYQLDTSRIPIILFSSSVLSYFLLCVYSLYKDMAQNITEPSYRPV